MSISFAVQVNRLLIASEIVRYTELVHMEILNISHGLRVRLSGLSKSDLVGRPGDSFSLAINRAATAAVHYFDVIDNESLFYASSSAELRTDDSIVLATSAAIAIAQLSGTSVIDDALLLSDRLEAEPSWLIHRIKSPTHQTDPHAAARDVVKRLRTSND